jgi:RNA polymerase-binding transcription factor DksA
MLIRKCDICKKEIKNRQEEIVAGIEWPTYSFCSRCGKSIIAFLKKRKLLPAAAKGKL